MKFCPKCGSIMLPKEIEGKKVLACSCGYSEGSTSAKIQEKVEKKAGVEVVDKDYETLPTTEEKCPKCGHGTAHFWEIQTRASDEPATKFLRCEKCKHTWRDYS